MKETVFSKVICFILQPILTTLYCFSKWWKPGLLIIFVLFTGWYAYTANPPRETMDIYYYINSFGNGEVDITDNAVDLYVNSMRYIVSLFSNNGHVFLGCCGLVIGFLFAISIKLFKRPQKYTYYYAFALILCFSNCFGLYTVGGIRYCTAFYLFFFVFISYLNTNDKKYLLLMLLVPLVHFSFLVLLIVPLICFVLKTRKNLSIILLFSSFILSFIPSELFVNSLFNFLNINIAGSIFSERTEMYANVAYLSNLKEATENTNIFIKYHIQIAYYGTCLSVLYLYFNRNNIKFDYNIQKLINYSIGFIVFRNFVSVIPDMNTRFTKLVLAILVYLIYEILLYNHNIYIKRAICIVVCSFVPIVSFTFLQNLELFDVMRMFLPIFL